MSPEDAAMLRYFIFEKDDVTRWVRWEEKKAALIASMPELDDYLRAQRAVEALGRVLDEALQAIEAKRY